MNKQIPYGVFMGDLYGWKPKKTGSFNHIRHKRAKQPLSKYA